MGGLVTDIHEVPTSVLDSYGGVHSTAIDFNNFTLNTMNSANKELSKLPNQINMDY